MSRATLMWYGPVPIAECTAWPEQQEDNAILRAAIVWYEHAVTSSSIFSLVVGLWITQSGYLKTRPCVEGLSYVRVDYCMYGCPYRKRTRLWTNCTEWTPKMCDRSHLVDGQHPSTAQRGPGRINDATFTRNDLHRLPPRLCDEIFAVCAARVS